MLGMIDVDVPGHRRIVQSAQEPPGGTHQVTLWFPVVRVLQKESASAAAKKKTAAAAKHTFFRFQNVATSRLLTGH